MPLLPGKANIGRNITELEEHGTRPRSHKQILAIALSEARKHPRRADGGGGLMDAGTVQPTAEAPYHDEGLFHSDVAGRTDRLPRTVPSDSFVFPADVVSSLGQGNTLAGAKILDGIFGGAKFADGGPVGNSDVIVAGGEYLANREHLKEIGRRLRSHGKSKARSDLNAGHEWARGFVDAVRKHQMDWLSKAPKPKR